MALQAQAGNGGRAIALDQIGHTCPAVMLSHTPERQNSSPLPQINALTAALTLPALIPPQISALVEPLDRAVIEHAGKQGAEYGPWVACLVAP